MKSQGLVVIAAVLSIVLVGGAGFLWAQTRVVERGPNPDEERAMITVEDLTGATPAVAYTPETMVRVFPSMPMLWLNYRRGGDVEIRSHLLRYDDVALARTGLERFPEGDGRWLRSDGMRAMGLPPCVDEGALQVDAEAKAFLFSARRGGSYVHVSASGWAPADPEAFGRAVCPSLEALDALPWPPKA